MRLTDIACACGSGFRDARFGRSAPAIFGGTSTVTFEKPFAFALSSIALIALAAAFEGESASTSMLSVTGTAPSSAFTCSSGSACKVEET